MTILNALRDWSFVEGKSTPTSASVNISLENSNSSSIDAKATDDVVSNENISVYVDC